ncbi:MAG: hypothetical protein ACQEQU_06690 [Spirochaetota bacterium]
MSTHQEQQQKKEKQRFVFKVGVVGWGISTAVIWTVLMRLLQPDGLWYRQLITALIVFPIAGIFFGRWMWNKKNSQAASSRLQSRERQSGKKETEKQTD